MNIFFLDRDPEKCAQAHCDKHVVKMILEYAQLLCSAHHVLGSGTSEMYKPTHKNHPSAVWVRESTAHYDWLYGLWLQLRNEYTFRYGKEHASGRLWRELFHSPKMDWDGWIGDPPQVMPEELRGEDAVEAYRLYYAREKLGIAKYTRREMPDWLRNKDWFNFDKGKWTSELGDEQ